MLIELVGLRMEKFVEAKDGDAKAVISAAIRSDFQRLQTLLPGEAVPFLKLKARYQLLEGEVTAAIQLYDKAVKLTGNPNTLDDYDLRSELRRPTFAPSPRRPARRGCCWRRSPRNIPTTCRPSSCSRRSHLTRTT